MKDKKIWLLGLIAFLLALNAGLLIYKNFIASNDKEKDLPVELASPSSTPERQKMPTTTIKFAETEWDFGNVKPNTRNEKIFVFKNEGPNPYIIENAFGSCGCTVPEYPKTPVPPNQEGKIKVRFEPTPAQKGQQIKTVTIVGNTEPERIILTIKANVVE